MTSIGAFLMAFMLTFKERDHPDKQNETVNGTALLIQFFLTTIFLPVKDLLISISFSYLYYYQANNLKRKSKKKVNKNKKAGANPAEAAGRVNEDTNRFSLDTDGVNKLLTSEVDEGLIGDKYANNKS
jgi:predicted membrane protein